MLLRLVLPTVHVDEIEGTAARMDHVIIYISLVTVHEVLCTKDSCYELLPVRNRCMS